MSVLRTCAQQRRDALTLVSRLLRGQSRASGSHPLDRIIPIADYPLINYGDPFPGSPAGSIRDERLDRLRLLGIPVSHQPMGPRGQSVATHPEPQGAASKALAATGVAFGPAVRFPQ